MTEREDSILADWHGMTSRVAKLAVTGLLIVSVASIVFAVVWMAIQYFLMGTLFGDARTFLVIAERLVTTGTPYTPSELTKPFGPLDPGSLYRYPPLFAQIVTLFSWSGPTSVLFVALMVLTNFASPLAVVVWRGGARRETLALAAFVAVFFLPDWGAGLIGQATGLLALGYAAALVDRPGWLWPAALLKVAPLVSLPVAAIRSPRAMARALLWSIPILAISILVLPNAWWQFPAVLWNSFTGGGITPSLAAGGVLRLVTLVFCGGAFIASLVLARRRWAFALYLTALVALLGPAFLSYYYLGVLAPFLMVALLDPRSRRLAYGVPLMMAVPVTPVLWAGMGLLGAALWRIAPVSTTDRSEAR